MPYLLVSASFYSAFPVDHALERSDIELAIGALRSRAEGFDFDARLCACPTDALTLQRNGTALRAVADALLYSLPRGR